MVPDADTHPLRAIRAHAPGGPVGDVIYVKPHIAA